MAGEESFSPGLEGVPAGKTGVSHVDPAGNTLIVRGYDIKELVDKSNFEEVAYLVLYGKLPTRTELTDFVKALKNGRKLSRNLLKLIKGLNEEKSNQMDILRTAVSYLGAEDAKNFGDSYENNLKKAASMIAKIPTIIAASYRYSVGQEPIKPKKLYPHAENFLYMLKGEEPDDFEANLFDKSLILYIDHDFNASTFTDIVVSSTLSDIYSAIVSGVCALKGPRHGGANEETAKMMSEVGNKDNAASWVQDKLSKGVKIPGFGHREYKVQDPRAIIMKEMFRQLGERKGDMRLYEIACEIENAFNAEMEKKGKHLPANVDFPCGGLYKTLGIPEAIYTPIFALSRVVGWCAHYMEYTAPVTLPDGKVVQNPIIRPKAIYSGPSGLRYVPIRKRF